MAFKSEFSMYVHLVVVYNLNILLIGSTLLAGFVLDVVPTEFVHKSV
jgi:hypothetical protein